MGLLRIPVRYLSMHGTSLEDNVESNIKYTETVWEINAEETAIVLVDVWSKHHLKTHMNRTGAIMANRIAPVIQSARKVGIPIIYAPTPEIARKYPQWTRYAGEEEIFAYPPSPKPQSDWPPKEFKERKGEYTKYSLLSIEVPPDHIEWYEIYREGGIADSIKPETEDFVVATGRQLHRLLKDRGILHLFYAGFATNICLIGRDYGMVPMRRRGYNLILLRDCTSAVENHYTVADLLTTKVFMMHIERDNASTTSEDFIKACDLLPHHVDEPNREEAACQI